MSERPKGQTEHFLPKPLRRVMYPVLGIIDGAFDLSERPEQAIAAERQRADDMIAQIDELTDRLPPTHHVSLPPTVMSVDVVPIQER